MPDANLYAWFKHCNCRIVGFPLFYLPLFAGHHVSRFWRTLNGYAVRLTFICPGVVKLYLRVLVEWHTGWSHLTTTELLWLLVMGKMPQMGSLALELMNLKAQQGQQRIFPCRISKFSSKHNLGLLMIMRWLRFGSIAAGQNTTVLLAKPNGKFSDLQRHPYDVQPPQECVGCKKDDGDPLECDKVLSNSPHLNIELTPRSSAILHGTSSAWTHLLTLFLTVNGSAPSVLMTLVHPLVSGGIPWPNVRGRELNHPRMAYVQRIDTRVVRTNCVYDQSASLMWPARRLCRSEEKETVTCLFSMENGGDFYFHGYEAVNSCDISFWHSQYPNSMYTFLVSPLGSWVVMHPIRSLYIFLGIDAICLGRGIINILENTNIVFMSYQTQCLRRYITWEARSVSATGVSTFGESYLPMLLDQLKNSSWLDSSCSLFLSWSSSTWEK